MPTLGELMLHGSMRNWSLRPGARLVKVLSPSALLHAGDPPMLSGYITQEKYLYGQTSTGIERILGLRPGELAQMVHVYALSRLPTPAEVDFRLSAAWPDGGHFDAAALAAHLKAREEYRQGLNLHQRSMVPVVQSYPPGSGMVPQWCLKKGVAIAASGKIATATAQFPFPRANGSIKPYAPHNRGPIR